MVGQFSERPDTLVASNVFTPLRLDSIVTPQVLDEKLNMIESKCMLETLRHKALEEEKRKILKCRRCKKDVIILAIELLRRRL